MIMFEKLFTLIIAESIVYVKFEAKDIVQSFIVLAFLVHLTQDCLAKVVRLVRQHFGVEAAREQLVPLFGEFLIRVWQLANKLSIQVQNVIHHVVADQAAFRIASERGYESLHDNREAHLSDVHVSLQSICLLSLL